MTARADWEVAPAGTVAEVAMLRAALSLYRADMDYAHRLAVMLECVLLDRRRAWDEALALLSEYRSACAESSS